MKVPRDKPVAASHRTMKTYTLRWTISGWLLLGGGAPVFAQYPFDEILGSVNEVIAEQASQWELDPDLVPFDQVDVNELNRVIGQLQKALDSGSLSQLASLRPYAEQALASMEGIPQLRSYASWLRERMDYFLVAEEVVRRPAPPKPTTRPTVPSPAQPGLPPPPVPAPAPSASPAEADYDLWFQRLKDRQPPANAARLVPRLKPVFRAENVAEEMVWLAEVESSFNPSAQSPVGAKGLYQFMPATAKEYGLSLSPHDERLDPDKNARAAASYLRYLYRRFGDWPLALAAYNAGQGRVGKLLRQTGGSTFEEIAAHLPTETRMYVPKMRAVVQIREGVDLRTL